MVARRREIVRRRPLGARRMACVFTFRVKSAPRVRGEERVLEFERCHGVFARDFANRTTTEKHIYEQKVEAMKWTFGVGVAFVALSTTAHAASGNTLAATDMYAGPGGGFPQVMHLAGNLKVEIHACLRNGLWCDVTWRGNRGWAPAQALCYRTGDERVALQQAPSQVPLIAFDLRGYWDQNYRDKLWYADASKWESRAPQTLSAAPRQ